MITLIPQIEYLIGLTTEEWKGNCYAVAVACVDAGVVEGEAEYGIWEGPIAPGSFFEGRPLARHGWVRLPDGQIWDPTRWVFENVEPYIYVGSDEFYDFGATRLRRSVATYDYISESQLIDFLDDPRLFEDEPLILHRIANTPPSEHPFFMAEAYEKLIEMGHEALIPVDFAKKAGVQ